MTVTAHPNRSLFISLPVRDPKASKDFFTRLGFGFDPKFSTDDGACLRLSEQTSVMLLSREKFAEFSKRPTADPTACAQALFCFGVESREEVDAVADAAAAGGEDHDDRQDHGFMYSRSFFDLDGHGWQVMWMDPTAE